jgi:hypothetical protein
MFEPSSAYHKQSAGKGEEANAALQVKNAASNATGHGVLTSAIKKSPGSTYSEPSPAVHNCAAAYSTLLYCR